MADIDDTRKNTNGLRKDSSSQESELLAGLGNIAGRTVAAPVGFMNVAGASEQEKASFNQNSNEVWIDEFYNVRQPGDREAYPVSRVQIHNPSSNEIIWQGENGGVLPAGHIEAVPVIKRKDEGSQGWIWDGNGERVYTNIDSMPERVKEEYRKAGFDLNHIMKSANNRHVQDFNEVDVNLFGLGGQMRTDRFGYTTWGANADPLNSSEGFSIGVGVGNVITPDGRRLSPEEMKEQSRGGSASIGASGGLLTANYSTPTDSRFYPELTTGMSTDVIPSASVKVSRMEEAPGWVTRVVRPVFQPQRNGLTEKKAYLLLEALKRNQHPEHR